MQRLCYIHSGTVITVFRTLNTSIACEQVKSKWNSFTFTVKLNFCFVIHEFLSFSTSYQSLTSIGLIYTTVNLLALFST